LQSSVAPRLAVRVVGWIAIVLVPLLTVEAMAAFYYAVRDGRYISVRNRLGSTPDTYVSAFNTRTGCRYVDTLYPHPYLAHAHDNSPHPCHAWANSIGLIGREYPLIRDPARFTILLAGGSVAAQLGQISSRGPFFLEEALNRCFKPPRGERFVVLNGGAGAWKHPNQAILFLLYGEAFDAVVTLDGFNEHFSLEHTRLEMPSNNFVATNPAAAGSLAPIAAAWLANELVRFTRENPVLGRSFVAYAAVSAARSQLERIATRPRPGGTTLERMFALPSDWSADQKLAFNLAQYRKYIRSIEALARLHTAKTAYFIQPVPVIGKVLTDHEKRVLHSPDYGPLYQRMADDLLGLSMEGVPIFSLLDVFIDERATLYHDHIHAKLDLNSDSPAYRMMAAAMAGRLGEAWGLERTCPDP
jgi:hypothetical protein